MIEQAVILAAGQGAGLGALTHYRTRATLPILGKPVMVRVMDRMREAGIRRFVVVIGAQDGSLASYLNSSWYPHTEVEYVLQPVARGPVDALKMAAKYVSDDFLLASIEDLTPPEHIPMLIERFVQTDADVVISVVHETEDLSVEAVVDGKRIIDIRYRPDVPTGGLAPFMVYACRRDFATYVKSIKNPRRVMTDVIQALIADEGHVGLVEAEYRYQLAADVDLLIVNNHYLDEGRDSYILSELPGTVTVIPPVRVDPGVRVGQGVRLGPYVYLESGCSIGDSAQIANAVVLQNAAIVSGEVCENQIVMRNHRIIVS